MHINKRDIAIFFFLLIANFLLRFVLVSQVNFDGLYGQDPYAYYDFAVNISQIPIGIPLPDSFYWGVGYPTILGTAFLVFGETELLALSINILLGSLLPGMLYILARQLSISTISALIIAILMSVSAQALQSSIVIMADIPGLFWGLLSGIALLQYSQKHALRWLILCTIALVLAVITRWIYGLLIIPWALLILLSWHNGIRWKDLLIAGIAGFLVAIPQIAYSSVSRYAPLEHSQVANWSLNNAFRSNFSTVDGVQEYANVNAEFYAAPFYDLMYLSPAFTVFILLGAISLIQFKHYKELLFIALWIIPSYIFLIGMTFQNIRFPLIILPPILLLVGFGFDWIIALFKRPAFHRFAVLTVIIVSIFGAMHMTAHAITNTQSFISRHQFEKEVVDWATDHIPVDARLYTFGLTLTAQHYTDLDVIQLYYETPETLQEQRDLAGKDFVLLNVWNIEKQWNGLIPQINYHWLRDTRGLEEIGRMGSYTLFRVLN